jgi:hypothetical protein
MFNAGLSAPRVFMAAGLAKALRDVSDNVCDSPQQQIAEVLLQHTVCLRVVVVVGI